MSAAACATVGCTLSVIYAVMFRAPAFTAVVQCAWLLLTCAAPGPEWVLITSWNEWYETTNVAPGTTTGTRALDQTRTWTRRFSGG